MKKKSTYATNSAGIIKAPTKPKDQPKSVSIKGNDLRIPKGKN